MKNGKAARQLDASLQEFHKISTILLKDVQISLLDQFLPLVANFQDGVSDRANVAFWGRTTIRTFLGLVDGLSFSMRKAVLRGRKGSDIALTSKEERDLADESLRPLDSFKLAMRTFPRLFGSEYQLDAGGEEWRGLKRIVAVRNKFTHPKVLEDLAFHPALPALMPTIQWVTGEVQKILGDINYRLNGVRRTEDAELAFPAYRESQARWDNLFTDDDYARIREVGGRSLAYVSNMFFMLNDDTRIAMDFLKESFPTHAIVLSPESQFAFRAYSRTLSSEIEGTIAAVRFFVEAAAQRNEVSVSEHDLLLLDEGEVEERFVAAMNLWSRKLGAGKDVLEQAGPNWKHMRGARAFRNRITHPKDAESLRVDLDLMDTLMGAHDFFLTGWGDGLYIDPDKWARVAGTIDDAIAEASNEAEDAMES